MHSRLHDVRPPFPRPLRERLVLALGVLTLLGLTPIVGHHLSLGAALPLQDAESLGAVCLVALHILLAPVHGVFHLLLGAGILYAVADRFRAWRRMRAAMGTLRRCRAPLPGRLLRAARSSGIGADRIECVPGLANPAFTAGLICPRMYFSTELVELLDDVQLHAVIAHEAVHLRRRDPLRLTVLRFFGCAMFWLPALRRIVDDIADQTEFTADDAAGRHDPLALAAALLAVARFAAPQPAGTANLVTLDLLEARVRRLAGEPVEEAIHVTRRSVAAAVGVLLLAWSSGAIMAHPLPDASEQSAHNHGYHSNCREHAGPAVLHLFCSHYLPGSGRDCDHSLHRRQHSQG